MSQFPPLRIGILGAADIARAFCAAAAASPLLDVAAVASRNAGKAAAFAAEFRIRRAHPGYEALLADAEVEAVYVPLPNDLHAEWAIRAAEAGKHVLCEKPLAMTADEARAMFAAARTHGVLLREAYPYMAQPQTLRLRELLREGVVGRVRSLSATMGFRIVTPEGEPLCDPANIRLQPERGGGALLDAGTYAMSMLRLLAGERPVRVWATADYTPKGVDHTLAATLRFAGGAIGQLGCSIATASNRFAMVAGEAGALRTDFSNHAPAGGRLPLWVKRGAPLTVPFAMEEMPGVNGFAAEADSFAHAVRLGAAEWNGATEAESVDTVLSLQAIAKCARTGGWVEVG